MYHRVYMRILFQKHAQSERERETVREMEAVKEGERNGVWYAVVRVIAAINEMASGVAVWGLYFCSRTAADVKNPNVYTLKTDAVNVLYAVQEKLIGLGGKLIEIYRNSR